MKVIKPSVDIIDQQGPGFEGMLRHIEKVGRISYLSYDRMTEDSYHKFVDMLIKIGHWSCLSCGTVYLNIPRYDLDLIEKLMSIDTLRKYGPFIRWYETGDAHLGLVMIVDENGTKRKISKRKDVDFTAMNYAKEGLTFILPQWAYKLREKISETCKWPDTEPRKWILEQDGEELWNTLTCEDRTASGREELWRHSEEEYIFEVTTEESFKLQPQDARGCMDEDSKTEFYMVGFLEDYFHEPEEGSPEKEGFFYLRTDKAAQDEVRVLSTELRRLYTEAGYDKLK